MPHANCISFCENKLPAAVSCKNIYYYDMQQIYLANGKW